MFEWKYDSVLLGTRKYLVWLCPVWAVILPPPLYLAQTEITCHRPMPSINLLQILSSKLAAMEGVISYIFQAFPYIIFLFDPLLLLHSSMVPYHPDNDHFWGQGQTNLLESVQYVMINIFPSNFVQQYLFLTSGRFSDWRQQGMPVDCILLPCQGG